MERVKKTLDLHKNGGLSCSQAVLTVYGESCGISSADARIMGRTLAGGVGGRGETCGYVTGAMVILAYAYNREDEAGARKVTHPIIVEFFRRFAEKRHSTICKEILGADISTEEGRKKIKEEKLFDKHCYSKDGIGRDVLDILEDLL